VVNIRFVTAPAWDSETFFLFGGRFKPPPAAIPLANAERNDGDALIAVDFVFAQGGDRIPG